MTSNSPVRWPSEHMSAMAPPFMTDTIWLRKALARSLSKLVAVVTPPACRLWTRPASRSGRGHRRGAQPASPSFLNLTPVDIGKRTKTQKSIFHVSNTSLMRGRLFFHTRPDGLRQVMSLPAKIEELRTKLLKYKDVKSEMKEMRKKSTA